MHIEQEHVKEFMRKAGQEVPAKPAIPSEQIRLSRLKWITEELCELANAWGIEFCVNNNEGKTDNFQAKITRALPPNDKESIINSYDALIDLLVFIIGSGVAMGVDLEPGWQEVHRSNMTKFLDGYQRADGKWMKGPSYEPPNIAAVVEQQMI